LLGVLAGPYALHLVDHRAVNRLELVNTLALALIALAGGVELRLSVLKETFRSLAWATVLQCAVLLVGVTATFVLLAPRLSFLNGIPLLGVFAVGTLWSILAISRSPSATLAILAQTKATGPLSRFSLAFVMSSDIVVVLLLAIALTFVRPMFDATASVSFSELLVLGHEIFGSVTLGISLGLVLALYLRLVKGQVFLFLLAIGYGVTEGLHYLRFDPLLVLLIAGFVVQNFSRQGPVLLEAVERMGSVVFVLFFATAGAHLDIPLLATLWPVALILCSARIVFSVIAHVASSRIARDEPEIRRWGWAPLISQAGLTLGLGVVIERAFPSFGPGLRSLAVATVAINEMIGPVLFKVALDRAAAARERADARGVDQIDESAAA
jgi:Kef-type K+ transport system membrane component KefB